MTISIWYLIFGLAVAYGLGIWIGWAARGYYHANIVHRIRRAVEWNS